MAVDCAPPLKFTMQWPTEATDGATRQRLCGGRGQIGLTRSPYACAAGNAVNGALSGRCWLAHILGAAELNAENWWPDTPEVFTATHQALESLAKNI